MFRDHPRRCGENLYFASVSAQNSGSPPQVRGKHRKNLINQRDYRITPAGAGKTPFAQCYYSTHQDHPRRCGENNSVALLKSTVLGSPPQVRGKLQPLFRTMQKLEGSPPQVRGKHKYLTLSFSGSRITPAGAGKTVPQVTNWAV